MMRVYLRSSKYQFYFDPGNEHANNSTTDVVYIYCEAVQNAAIEYWMFMFFVFVILWTCTEKVQLFI